MENRFVAQLREKVSAVQKTTAPEVSMCGFGIVAAVLAGLVPAEDAGVTMSLDDAGRGAASIWEDERDFESSIRRVLQMQTVGLQVSSFCFPCHGSMVKARPQSLLLQAELATEKVRAGVRCFWILLFHSVEGLAIAQQPKCRPHFH